MFLAVGFMDDNITLPLMNTSWTHQRWYYNNSILYARYSIGVEGYSTDTVVVGNQRLYEEWTSTTSYINMVRSDIRYTYIYIVADVIALMFSFCTVARRSLLSIVDLHSRAPLIHTIDIHIGRPRHGLSRWKTTPTGIMRYTKITGLGINNIIIILLDGTNEE